MTDQSFGDDNTNTNPQDQQNKGDQGTFDQNQNADQSNNAGGGGNQGTSVQELQEQINKLNKRLQDKDEFIDTLKNERRSDESTVQELQNKLSELEQKVQKSASIEEVMERMQNQQTGTNDTTNHVDPQELEEKLKSSVLSEIEQQQLSKQYEQNFNDCFKAAVEAYGNEKAGEEIRRLAGEYDMTIEEVDDLARKRPKFFKDTFLPKGQKPTAPSQGSVNSAALKDTPNSRSDQTPYPKLRSSQQKADYVNKVFQRMQEEGKIST